MPVQVIKARSSVPISTTEGESGGMRLRIAAYARVSTDSEDQESSYDVQCSHFTNQINSDPTLIFVGMYSDEGVSGTSLKKRDGFNRMIRDCEAGLIDEVRTKSISRFARNTVDCLNAIRKLKSLGIPIVFEKENINTLDAKGEILVTIMASLAQQESGSISQNVTMGIRYHMAEGKGNLNYNRFLGYTKKDGRLVIVPEEAVVVRRIFREFLEGFSAKRICMHLEAGGIPTATGKTKWHPSTIISMLENEKYAGDLLLQKYYTEDFLTHKTRKNDGKFPQYFVEDDHPAIVPKVVYYQVQGELMRRTAQQKSEERPRFGSMNALAGRLVCGRCGRTLKRYTRPDVTRNEWRCRERAATTASNSNARAGECGCRHCLEREVQSSIVKAFNKLPEHRTEIELELTRLREGELRRIDALIEASQEAESRMETQRTRLEEMRADTAVMDSQIREEHARRDALLLERAGHASKEMYLRLLAELLTLLEEPTAAYSAAHRTDSHRVAVASHSEDEADAASRGEEDGGDEADAADVKVNTGDWAVEQFFRMTRPRYADGVIAEGKVVSFCDEMVVRYLEKVVVEDDEYVVKLKGGVEIAI